MANKRPNIILILSDDMGYSDLGCYGGEILTPNLDRLADTGLRFTQFYNTARCCPSRASLLTGLHPHQAGVGQMVKPLGPDGYEGKLNRRCVTIAEVLQGVGYRTYMSGKWHVCGDTDHPTDAWPCQRGFHQFYGIIAGAASYYWPATLARNSTNIEHEAESNPDFYLTDALSENAAQFIYSHTESHFEDPFFLYLAYTSPHWPLHAKQEDIQKYEGRFDAGWDNLRDARLARMRTMGLLPGGLPLSPRDPAQPAWESAEDRGWQSKRMEVYAAQVDRMDKGIGQVLDALEKTGEMDNTVVLFLSDNGGCHEEIHGNWIDWMVPDKVARLETRDGRPVRIGNDPAIDPGCEDTYCSYGVPWANLSNTPFRMYKCWVHEGGISTPLIVRWPAGIPACGELCHQPAQLPDVMATLLEVTGADYPATRAGVEILPCEGVSLVPALSGALVNERMLFWEHEGNAAIRNGKWKLVRNFSGSTSGTPGFDRAGRRGEWELYDIEADRSEMHDLATDNPEIMSAMLVAYQVWAQRVGVISGEDLLRLLSTRNVFHDAGAKTQAAE